MSDDLLFLASELAALREQVRELQGREVSIADIGTWTPTVSGGTTPGSTTHTTQIGQWTRIGRILIAAGRVSWSATTATGTLDISLPMVASNLNSGAMRYAVSVWFPAQPSAQFFIRAAEQRMSAFTTIPSSGDIIFTATYFV